MGNKLEKGLQVVYAEGFFQEKVGYPMAPPKNSLPLNIIGSPAFLTVSRSWFKGPCSAGGGGGDDAGAAAADKHLPLLGWGPHHKMLKSSPA